MRKLKLTPTRQQNLLKALADTGSVSTATAVAGKSNPCLRASEGRSGVRQRVAGG
jgi:hypothetical protein